MSLDEIFSIEDPGIEKVKWRSPRDAPVTRDHEESEARRLLAAGLHYCGRSSEDLKALRKGDERKLIMVALVRQRTNVPNAWLAKELQLGHVSWVRNHRGRPKA